MTEETFKREMKFSFVRRNNSKYHKYFNEWFKNITPTQKNHFTKEIKNPNIYD